MKAKIAGLLIVSLWISFPVVAQQKPVIAPAEKLAEGWDEIDQRLVFLMVRLANVETSLDAVENAIGKSSGKRSSNLSKAKRAEAGIERMDRQGGGPLKWSEFYGRTAEKFFYHPTDRNSTYHTVTVLNQRGPEADNKVGGGVPAGQGLPVHQRPPQFDYIYRANENAKAKAEEDATELKGKVEALIERRQRLEVEQAGLWCEVAFRAVSHYDLDKKPLYRFEPLIVGVDSESRQHAESMKAAAIFMGLALSIIDEAQKDQASTFSRIKNAISDSRQKLNDGWLRLAVDVTDRKTPEGRFAALAKRLDDVASNLSDSYEVANEGDEAKDQQRKDTFRALLQESLVNYAQIVLALDEMASLMKDEWKVKPDVDKPIMLVRLVDTSSIQHGSPTTKSAPSAPRSESADEPIIGRWANVRGNTTVHEFLPDGEYVFSQGGKTARGAWQRDGTKVSFQAKSGDGQLAIDKWLVVVSRRGDQLDVRLEGDRPYSWRAIKTENDGNGGRASSTLTALQGNWKAIQLWANGKQNTNPDFWREPKTLSVQGKNFTLVLIDGTFRGTLDADGSDDPPQITFKPVDRNGMELRGVYQANGDELTICWVIYHKAMGREPQRPTTLEPAQGVMKFVFRR